MPQVEIPADLFEEVKTAANGNSTEQFVNAALREKLGREQRLKEFARLAEENRAAMEKAGVTEEEILANFEQWRREHRNQPRA